MTQPIRVAVANQPRLIRELVLGMFLEQPDIEIVAEIQSENEIVHIVEGTHPDFLILALDASNKRPALCDVLLLRYPEMKILAISPERNISLFISASLDIHESQVESSEAGICFTHTCAVEARLCWLAFPLAMHFGLQGVVYGMVLSAAAYTIALAASFLSIIYGKSAPRLANQTYPHAKEMEGE